jgi:hypothetical protein
METERWLGGKMEKICPVCSTEEDRNHILRYEGKKYCRGEYLNRRLGMLMQK